MADLSRSHGVIYPSCIGHSCWGRTQTAALDVTYGDFAAWHQHPNRHAETQRQVNYWHEVLSPYPNRLLCQTTILARSSLPAKPSTSNYTFPQRPARLLGNW